MNFINEEKKEEEKRENINNSVFQSFDNTDYRIISLLVLGQDNKKISFTLKIPLSTIQRRTRRILQSEIVTVEYTPNFKMLGIKKGLLHTYLEDGKLRQTAEKISEMEGILSVSIHVGNSDIVSEFVYEDSEDLVDIIASIKQLGGVDRAMWSEEIIKLPTQKENIMKSFRKYWNNNTNHNNNGQRRKNNNNNNNNNKNNRKNYL
jgi:DNA-binding Lrp family transcriptional regulator